MMAVLPSTAATAVLTARSTSASNFVSGERRRLAGAIGKVLVNPTLGEARRTWVRGRPAFPATPKTFVS
jgi:hypothetical protein